MMKQIIKASAWVWGCMLLVAPAFSQDIAAAEAKDPEYVEVLKGRATKIVNTLDISEAEKQTGVRNMIVMQYYNLSQVQDARDARIKAIEEQLEGNEKKRDKKIEKVKKKARKKVKKLHKKYIARLSGALTADQVTKVKDGMTYGVVPLTYKGYLALLPGLTSEQKAKILAYLEEAREIAMDAGSSEKKHYWFGQYKGKINNYLSSEGYDLKEAEKALKARSNAD